MLKELKARFQGFLDKQCPPEEDEEYEKNVLPVLPPNLKKVVLPRRLYKLILCITFVSGIVAITLLSLFFNGIMPPKSAQAGLTVIYSGQMITVPEGYIIQGNASFVGYVGPQKILKTPYKTMKKMRIITRDVCVVYDADEENEALQKHIDQIIPLYKDYRNK